MRLVKSKAPVRSGGGKPPESRTTEELLGTGVVVIDKPSGPTSHQVTSWVREMLGASKAAHGGTLDPRVTGVLPVGLGVAVRAMDALHTGTKSYVGVMRAHGNIDRARLESVFSEFKDEIFQTPPVRSAVKREQRTRRIHALRLLEVSGRDVLFDVDCDSGTYIRSLCVDMGDALGIGAHLQDLRRTRAATMTEASMHSLQDLRDAFEEYRGGDETHLRGMLMPFEVLLAHVPKVEVKDSAVDAICHGADLALPGIVSLDDGIAPGDLVAVVTMSGEGVGLGKALMGAREIVERREGIAVDVSRVFMQTGTYNIAWGAGSRE
jgi:H/ACA ribonucleoprotein complex subunit 4